MCRNLCFVTYKREDLFSVWDSGDAREMAAVAARLALDKLSLNPLLLLSTWKDNTGTRGTCRPGQHLTLATAAMMARLLEMGADPRCQDGEGRTCLHLAANNDSRAAAEILIKMKVSPRRSRH